MRLIRTSMPTLALLAAVAALASGVVLSTVEARHHKSSSHHGVATADQNVVMQQVATANSIKAMTVAGGIQHSTVCPHDASSVDACFTGKLSAPATDASIADAAAGQMLDALQVVLGPALGCVAVSGGPWGSGYDCTASGTWHSAPVDAFVFVSSQARSQAGAPRLESMLTVLPTSR